MKGYKYLLVLLIAIVMIATVTSAVVRPTNGPIHGPGCIFCSGDCPECYEADETGSCQLIFDCVPT
ncbi:hypothetical protein Anas_05489 [Armadillidium nasatum]|uniref:Uncharacterized protein n=1 Tax=Armadillidium nasatum TaxID=96803 RepID=A0A5N5TKK6_9CRUS|nr:hypothetical protein Anas_05489 [Armadillidium nasatum]